MKHQVVHRSTRRVFAVSITIIAAVFAIAHFRASASLRSPGRGLSEISARAQNPDSPWIKLQNSRAVPAEPTSLAVARLDDDQTLSAESRFSTESR